MLTRLRPSIPEFSGDWNWDGPILVRWLVEYWLALESKNALTIDSATGIDNTPVGANAPSTGAFTTLAATALATEKVAWTPTDGSGAGLALTIVDAKYSKQGAVVWGYCKITYPATASGLGAQINGLPFAAASQVAGAFGATAGTATWCLVNGSSFNPEPPAGGGVTNATLSGATIWASFLYFV